VFLGLRHQLPVMRAQRSGVVISTASILGLVGLAGAAAYVTAKHGVIGLTRTAALETAPVGVRVNAICPGFVETPMVTVHGLGAARGTALFDEIEALHPVGRIGQPGEVARAARFLASPDAALITGQTLVMVGGFLAQ
jgi:NAD(P)-dependent dehydrogenase (short-subunit alcohol dehydrogenase family)